MTDRLHLPVSRLIARHHLWAPLVAVLAALAFRAVAGWALWVDRALDTRGAEVTGVVAQREIVARRSRDGGETIHEPVIHYRFTPPGGAERRDRAVVSTGFHDRHQIGDPLVVRYLPGNPGLNRIEATGRSARAVIFLSLAGVMLVLAGVAAAKWVPLAASARRAAMAPGRTVAVTGHARVDVADGAAPRGRALFEGGATGPMPRQALPPVGAPLRVRTDPRTGRVWWEGDL